MLAGMIRIGKCCQISRIDVFEFSETRRVEDIEGAECFVLVETSGGKREHDEQVLSIDSW